MASANTPVVQTPDNSGKVLCTVHSYWDGSRKDSLAVNNENFPVKTKPSEICVHVWPDVGHAALAESTELTLDYNFSWVKGSNITLVHFALSFQFFGISVDVWKDSLYHFCFVVFFSPLRRSLNPSGVSLFSCL